MRAVRAVLACLVLTGVVACGSAQSQLLLNASGAASTNATQSQTRSGAILANGAFDIAYSWDCTTAHQRGQQHASGFQYLLYNSDDDTLSFETPQVARQGATGSGTVHYHVPGEFYVVVTTQCDWRLRMNLA